MATIKFYRVNEPYGCFSNFSRHPIVLDGKEWPTSEHYFQAKKFAGTTHEKELRRAKSAREVAQMGRDRNRPFRKDWEKVKDSIMLEALKAKVDQHQDVREILLSTGDCTLIEHTKNDSYWADGGDGSGLNKLGEFLMEIRNKLPQYSPIFFEPQWIAHPDIERSDMFWRMGKGEDYIIKLAEWFYGLSERAQKEWKSYYHPPEEWKDAV